MKAKRMVQRLKSVAWMKVRVLGLKDGESS